MNTRNKINIDRIFSSKFIKNNEDNGKSIDVYLDGHKKPSYEYQWYDVDSSGVLKGKTSENETVYLYFYDDLKVASIKFRGDKVEFDRHGNAYSDFWFSEVDVDEKDENSVNLSLRLFG